MNRAILPDLSQNKSNLGLKNQDLHLKLTFSFKYLSLEKSLAIAGTFNVPREARLSTQKNEAAVQITATYM